MDTSAKRADAAQNVPERIDAALNLMLSLASAR